MTFLVFERFGRTYAEAFATTGQEFSYQQFLQLVQYKKDPLLQ